MKLLEVKKIKTGSGFKIADSSKIICDELIIGNDVVIDERVKIVCENGKVEIGDQVYIGNDVNILVKSLIVGEYTKIHNHTLINGVDNINIGENCWIGQNCILNSESSLYIGNNVGIGTYTSIWTHGYFGQLVDGCNFYSVKSTEIQDDVWLVGSYNTIFPGVSIGKKSIILGTSVVTRSLDAMKVYSGNPAKDITDKLGKPYTEISFIKKIKLISDAIEIFLIKNNILFTKHELYFSIEGYGLVFFFNSESKIENSLQNSIGFYKKITNWEQINNHSKFCLETKKYQKKYTPLEILVKKILNPTTARFIKF